MKLSLRWLQDFIEFSETDPQKIADVMSNHIAEVDEVEQQGALLNNCVVGKILTLKKHPDADKLSLCTVHTEQGKKQVVCGGSNLYEGMRVAFAHVGAQVLWHGKELATIESVKIRGEKSDGMICTAEELDITAMFPESTDRTILDLGDGDDGVGESLREYLRLTDTIIHIDNHAITHRADLFSQIGFARECVAVGLAKWKKKPEYKMPKFGTEAPLPVEHDVPELVPRYCACTLEIDDLGETPDWMKERLIAVGWRPLNLPVDITNFVASEVGDPLHSFDVDDIKGTVHMRPAKKGEKLVTLDKKERELPEGGLILSDDEGVFDLLGIMGGLRSSTKESTRRIYLHSDSLHPATVRMTMMKIGLRTDAGTIYEKGVPHIISEQGFLRALNLMLELIPGARVVSSMVNIGDNGNPAPITLSVARVESMLGIKISSKEITDILQKLEFTVEGEGDTLQVTPPLHRLGDITADHDLIEEVGRMYGYNKIENTLPEASIQLPDRDQRVDTMRDTLVQQGFFELIPLSLIGPDVLTQCQFDPEQCIAVDNAIGRETSILAPSTLPALLVHAQESWLQFRETLKTFHIAQVFPTTDGHRELGALVSNKHDGDIKRDPFLVLKRDLGLAMKNAGYPMQLDICKDIPHMAHPGRVAAIQVDGTTVGTLCELQPTLRQQFDITGRAAYAMLDVSALLALPKKFITATPVPQFPAVQYDATVTMTHEQSAAALLAKIRETSDLLESVEVADLYSGAPLQAHEYNLTIRCTYRALDRTLTEEETKQAFASIEKLTS